MTRLSAGAGARSVAVLVTVACLTLAATACGAGETSATGRGAASAAVALPKDVRDFLARREQCDHFRGEEAADAKRQAFIDAKLKEFCAGTDGQLAALRQRYKADRAVTKALSGLDTQIE